MKKRLVALAVGFMLVLSTLALAACSDENPDPSPSGGETATYDVSGKIELRLDEMDAYKKLMRVDQFPKYAEYVQLQKQAEEEILRMLPDGGTDVYVDGVYATTARKDLTYALKNVKKDAKIKVKLNEQLFPEVKPFAACLTYPEYTVTKADQGANLTVGLNMPQFALIQSSGSEDSSPITSDIPLPLVFSFSRTEIENGIPELVLVNGKNLLPLTSDNEGEYISQDVFTSTADVKITLGGDGYMLSGRPRYSLNSTYFKVYLYVFKKDYALTVVQNDTAVAGVEVSAHFPKSINFTTMTVELVTVKATTDAQGIAKMTIPSDAISTGYSDIRPLYVGAKKEGLAFSFDGNTAITAYPGTVKTLTLKNEKDEALKDVLISVNNLLCETKTDAQGTVTFIGRTGQEDVLSCAASNNPSDRLQLYEKTGDSYTEFNGYYPADQTALTLYQRDMRRILVYGAEHFNYDVSCEIIGTKPGAQDIVINSVSFNQPLFATQFVQEAGYTYQIKPREGSNVTFDAITIGTENEYKIQNVKFRTSITISDVYGTPVAGAKYTVKALDGTEIMKNVSNDTEYIFIDETYLKKAVKIEVTAEGYTVQPQYYVLLELGRTNTIRLERTV